MATMVSWAITLVLAIGVFAGVRWMGVALNGVATDSMVPTLQPTDLVLSVSPRVVSPGIGRIVVFEADFAGKHIPPHVHRIVGQNPDGTWQTQGDHATTPDPWSVRPDQILGVVVGHVPSKLIRSPLLIGLLVLLVAIAGLWPAAGDDDEDGIDEGAVVDVVDPYDASTAAGGTTILPRA